MAGGRGWGPALTSVVGWLFVRHLSPRQLAADQALDLLEPALEQRDLAVQRNHDVVQLGDRLGLIGVLFFEVEETRGVGAGHGRSLERRSVCSHCVLGLSWWGRHAP